MSKILVLADTHAGCRNDSPQFNSYSISFYKDILFPYIKNNSIKKIVHLGDVFDRRKYINLNTLSEWIENVFNPLHEMIEEMDIIIGNHDCYFTNTNSVNSVSLIFSNKYPKFKVYSDPVEIGNVLYVPWICEENKEKTYNLLSQTKCIDCFGHLEIIGFEHFKGHFNEDKGENRDLFSKFRNVLTGHFHHKSSQGNIHYLGSPYEMSWSDCGDAKGFHLYDIQTGKLDFIKNPTSIFKKINYNDLLKIDVNDFSNVFVKVIVPENHDPVKLDFLKESLDKVSLNTAIVPIITESIDGDDIIEENIQMKDTIDILKDGVSDQNIDQDRKNKLFQLLNDLYMDALNSFGSEK